MGGVLSSTSPSNPNHSPPPTSSSPESYRGRSPRTSPTPRMSDSDSVSPKSEEIAGVKETLEDQASSSSVESRKVEDGAPQSNFAESEMVDEWDGGEIGEEEGQDGEEEGECGFCLFMKGGGCKESFVAWEQCIEEAEKNKEDIVEKCFQATSALKKCMEANSDYYEPILRAEKNAEEEAVKQLKEEAASNELKQDALDSEKRKISRDSEGKASDVDK